MGEIQEPIKIQGLAPIHRLIVLILKQLGRELGTIELVKIVYLIDVEFFRLFGKTLTGLTYIRWDKGPYTKKISEAVVDLEEKEVEVIKTKLGPSRGFSIFPKKSHNLEKEVIFDPGLLPEEEEVITQLLKRIKDTNVRGLEDLAYKTEPMKVIVEKEKKTKNFLQGAPLDFSLIKRDEFMKHWLDNRESEKVDPGYDQSLAQERKEFDNFVAQALG